MGLATVYSRANIGVEAPLVTVEVHLGGGLPRISIVGLPETSVREARDRVKAALQNAGFQFPQSNITISLAPADLRKEGSRFDLPIAVGILAASGQVPDRRLGKFEFIGELSLSGRLNPVTGILPVALQAKRTGHGLIMPSPNGPEAALADCSHHRCADSLLSVVDWLHGREDLSPVLAPQVVQDDSAPDLSDVCGQEKARRALEIAAAGRHNFLLYGPPGTGKTMLASRLPGLLPALRESAAIEAAAVASISHAGLDSRHWRKPPFRAPHHSASSAALVGGGRFPQPGEISLAHHGVLFLDELPEFNRDVLEVLREPLESGHIVISRALGRADFPADFQLIAAMNPCPCGYYGDRAKDCVCSAEQISRYRNKVSGPLLDRIDVYVEVARPKQITLPGKGRPGESSAAVRKRVDSARQTQFQRQGVANARLDSLGVKRHCRLGAAEESFFEAAALQLNLSPRGCLRVLKVARTIADLDEAHQIGQDHLAEAIGYRQPGNW